MVLTFFHPLARFAVLIRQRCLAGIGFALVVGAAPKEAVFSFQSTQTAIFTVGAGEGFFRASERLNRGVRSEYRQLRVERLVVVRDHRTVARLALGDGVEVVFHIFGLGIFEEVETAAQRLNQRRAEFGRHKLPFDHLNVTALLNRADDAGVG